MSEGDVLLHLEYMLRSRRIDERFTSDMMSRLSHALRPAEGVIIPPDSHPFATIRRSKSVNKGDRKTDKSLSRSHPRLMHLESEPDGGAILMRSTSLKAEKPQGIKIKKRREEEVLLGSPQRSAVSSQSKSLHSLTESVSTKDKLYGWMETQISPSKSESGSVSGVRRTNSGNYGQHPLTYTKQQSTPDTYNMHLLENRPMTQKVYTIMALKYFPYLWLYRK